MGKKTKGRKMSQIHLAKEYVRHIPMGDGHTVQTLCGLNVNFDQSTIFVDFDTKNDAFNIKNATCKTCLQVSTKKNLFNKFMQNKELFNRMVNNSIPYGLFLEDEKRAIFHMQISGVNFDFYSRHGVWLPLIDTSQIVEDIVLRISFKKYKPFVMKDIEQYHKQYILLSGKRYQIVGRDFTDKLVLQNDKNFIHYVPVPVLFELKATFVDGRLFAREVM